MLNKLRNPLYRNSIFLMLSSAVAAGTGFIFWIIAARLYSTEDVGLSSAIVSAMRLLVLLSFLGLDIGFIRYLPEKENKGDFVNSSLTIIGALSIALSLIFCLSVDFIAPPLKLIQKYAPIFVLFVLMTALSTFMGQSIFVAFRRAEYTLYQSTTYLLRIFLLPFLVSFGAIGVFLAFGAGFLLAFIFGILMISRLIPNYIPRPRTSREINDVLHYSFGMYAAKIFESLPNLALPIIVLNMLGAEENAYFFIAWSVMFFLTMPSRMTGMSYLAECSHDSHRLRDRARESLKFVVTLLFLAIAGIYLFGDVILGFFGRQYSESSFLLLKTLAIGCIPYALSIIYASAMMVKKKVKEVVAIYGGIAMLTIVLSYLFVIVFGTIGVAYAWIAANVAVAVGVIVRVLF